MIISNVTYSYDPVFDRVDTEYAFYIKVGLLTLINTNNKK